MNDFFDPITIVMIVAAVIILFKLRSVLGERTGHQDPVDPFSTPPERKQSRDADQAPDDNVVVLPRNDDRGAGNEDGPLNVEEPKIPSSLSDFKEQIGQIRAIDHTFDPEMFLQGAKSAYELIVVAFAEGDKKALRGLLSAEVFDGFSNAIDERMAEGLQMSTDFIGIDSANLSRIEMEGKSALVTVEFVSELVSTLSDKSGKLIEGDPNEVQKNADVWTFQRDLTSRDPNWKLVATDGEED